jgi:diaminobutyrate-2-oxoglutarate transaminase
MKLCRELGIVTILDEIQAGVGRTGEYFSFPALGDEWPDIICLSKSISGLGLPLSLVLVKRELDVLEAGENSGTFRGNCLAVESAGNALELFAQASFQSGIRSNLEVLDAFMSLVRQDDRIQVRGRGMLRGLAVDNQAIASRLIARCRDERILLESCGGAPDTVKVMPPLTCNPGQLSQALETVLVILREVLDDVRPG